MTLTEFLFARIAEDEERHPEHGFFVNRELHDIRCMEFGAVERSDAVCDCDGPKRWLAECEAKRRIVKTVTYAARQERRPAFREGVYDVVEVREPVEELGGDVVLPLLALPYADHPDYLPEWRP